MKVHFYNNDCKYRLPAKRLTASWLCRVAEAEGVEFEELSYIFCSSERLLEMNREFLGHDYRTDVITFENSFCGPQPPPQGARKACFASARSGEIYIDVDTVADNARQYGVAKLMEMRRVMVHGLLHLCGYDDMTPIQVTRMREKEDFYLRWI